MSDYYLTKFWKDIKDTSWPDIRTWDDFVNVNNDIKQECYDIHGLQERLDEIESVEYWRSYNAGELFKKDQFVFINVAKCGSRHYLDFFVDRLGWEIITPSHIDDTKPCVKFGLMMHPLDRYLKGVTEFVWRLSLTDHIDLKNFVRSCFFPDIHSVSYDIMFGSDMHDIHWIPYKSMTSEQTKSCMNSLFELYGSEINIPLVHPALHESSPRKRELFNRISKIWQERQEPILLHTRHVDKFNSNLYLIYQAYAKDLKFYRQLISTFKPDWSHIKGKLGSNG